MAQHKDILARCQDKIADLRTRYDEEALSSGGLQVHMKPEEAAELLACPDCPQHLAARLPKDRACTHVIFLPSEIEELLSHHERATGKPNKPADVPG